MISFSAETANFRYNKVNQWQLMQATYQFCSKVLHCIVDSVSECVVVNFVFSVMDNRTYYTEVSESASNVVLLP